MATISRLYVSSDDLHAFIDEMLPPRAAARVASAIEHDEGAQRRVADYVRQKSDLKLLYSDVLDEPVPPTMLDMITAARR